MQEIDLRLDFPIPRSTQTFLEAADRVCDEFFDTGANKKIPRFLPADYELVYKGLAELKKEHPLLGYKFCEWGSGLGTATCLAASLGYEATGIEIQHELILRARRLASDSKLPAHFIEGSFLPEGFDFLQTQGGMELMTPPSASNSSFQYTDESCALDEVDVFYAYPWPEEQEATLALFEAVASLDAYLLIYFSEQELHAFRK